MANNPFDLENYKPQISMKDVARDNRCAYHQTANINAKRAKGVEPFQFVLPGSYDMTPKKLALKMPTMPTRRKKK